MSFRFRRFSSSFIENFHHLKFEAALVGKELATLHLFSKLSRSVKMTRCFGTSRTTYSPAVSHLRIPESMHFLVFSRYRLTGGCLV